ncbi:hypothetical protein [Planococcus soli]|uniref:hypothetical protein n=1 Tax=Planococcus soli TaxID=2666072 RepID=UPI00115CD974|nr:hypothetical protein [Planococcus soli]
MKKSIWIGNLLAMLFLLSACSVDSEKASIEEASSMNEISGILKASIQVPNQSPPILVEFNGDGGTLYLSQSNKVKRRIRL